jgi:hypothetical protein
LTHARVDTLVGHFENDKSLRHGSISIGFGWGRVQSEQENMPHGPCDGPEA